MREANGKGCPQVHYCEEGSRKTLCGKSAASVLVREDVFCLICARAFRERIIAQVKKIADLEMDDVA